MQMKRSDRIHYLSAEFSGTPCSVQGFTTRHEGISRPPYNSLNLGTTTLDQQHNVEGNRSLLARAFGVTQEALDHLVRQRLLSIDSVLAAAATGIRSWAVAPSSSSSHRAANRVKVASSSVARPAGMASPAIRNPTSGRMIATRPTT